MRGFPSSEDMKLSSLTFKHGISKGILNFSRIKEQEYIENMKKKTIELDKKFILLHLIYRLIVF